jgi:hypothetical protein
MQRVQAKVGANDARRDERDLDVRMRGLHFRAQHRGERIEEMLRARVRGANRRKRHAAEQRRDVDDVPLAALLEVRQHRLHAVQRRVNVGAHHSIQILVSQLGRIARDALTGVVHPDIDAPELLQRPIHDALHLRANPDVGDLHVRSSAAARGDILQRGFAARHEHDLMSLRREQLAQRRPNP